MNCDDDGGSFAVNLVGSAESLDAPSAVNSSVLNYYKKFGRKRDLEQFFSLSTAQSDIRDPRSAFWRKMKAPSDSSDSGDNRGKSESSLEVCRISIRCSAPEEEPGRSQYPHKNVLDKSESVSPPIVTEDAAIDTSHHTEEECVKSDGEHSHKSMDVTLDTSMNKPFSPTSSITSQRKLEWDSLADVGYANESDCKNSANSLSTLERLALKQQYSYNDTQPDKTKIGTPTAHSTPQEDTDMKSKGKRGKTTKFHSREVDLVEFNMLPISQTNSSQAISVNLTKHISFNVEKDGGVTLQNAQKNVSTKPEKVYVENEMTPHIKIDKEIQTSLKETKDKSSSSGEISKNVHLYGHRVPVLINLNTMRRRTRKKKFRPAKKKLQKKRTMDANKENLPVLEKSGEQVSEAESFEYMPGHIYNQNQLNNDQPRHSSVPDNKSSLESSGALTTTDSSKASKNSFTKDLEKSITLLKTALQSRYDDTCLKQRLIKEVVERLIKSNYRGDESTTDFLSGLSFSSKKLGLAESNQTTTSTSDGNNTADKSKLTKPKKSILRSDKINSNAISCTSQSAPNLPCASKSDLPVISCFRKPIISSTNTESDVSSKEKLSSDVAAAKTPSEELYNKYLNALRREQAYKKHLREKKVFLKQKLGSSDTVLKFPVPLNSCAKSKVKDLMKDLTRNNYDDGSGDASKLEVGSSCLINTQRNTAKPQRSHSVFTLSSGGSSCQYNKPNPRKNESKKAPRATDSKDEHYCCCPYHTGNIELGVMDSAVQVDINSIWSTINPMCSCHKRAPPATKGDKYVCFCANKPPTDKIVVYKCPNRPSNVQLKDSSEYMYDNKPSKSSQTNLALNLLGRKHSDQSSSTSIEDKHKINICLAHESEKKYVFVHEGIRCTQTEISINPKISDPHLSDIEIVCNCAELIGEQFREVSKSSIQSESVCVGQQNADVRNPMDNIPNSPKEDKCVQSACEYQETVIHPQIFIPTGSQDNYRIPIQGTNMTLMVSMDSKTDNDPTQKVRKIGELRIAADTVKPLGFIPNLKNSALSTSASKTIAPSECFPNNTYPSNNPSPVAPIFSTGSLNNYDPQNDIGEELANYEYSKIKQKCIHPETVNRKNSRECMTPKSQSVQTPAVAETLTLKNSMKKSKCVCPEIAKCRGDCGPDALCMNSKPLCLYTDTKEMAKAIFKIDSPRKPESARDFGTCSPISNLSICTCGPSAKCGGTCGPDAPCINDKPKHTDLPKQSGTSEPTQLDESKLLKFTDHPKQAETCEPTGSDEKNLPKFTDLSKQSGTCEPTRPDETKPLIFPDLSKQSGTCEPTRPDVTKQPVHNLPMQSRTRSPTETDVQSLAATTTTQDYLRKPDTGYEPNIEKLTCVYHSSAKCGQSCDENALSLKIQTKIPKTNPSRNAPSLKDDISDHVDNCAGKSEETPEAKCNPIETMIHYKTNPGDARDDFVQTDPLGKSQSSTQTEDKFDSSSLSRPLRAESGNSSGSGKTNRPSAEKDLVLDMIQEITKRYSKKDIEKNQKKKCFKEIMTVLNYLLDIDDNPNSETGDNNNLPECYEQNSKLAECSEVTNKLQDSCKTKENKETESSTLDRIKKTDECCGTEKNPVRNVKMAVESSTDESCLCGSNIQIKDCKSKAIYLDKSVQSCIKKCGSSIVCPPTSCGITLSTDNPCSTSSDTTTCRVLNRIRKECDKYHQKRCCSSHGGKGACETSSTTSISCQNCKRTHHCYCKGYRCRGSRSKACADTLRKKCIAYNLIIQTSESMLSEETPCKQKCRPLKNIVVKVPPKHKVCGMPFKEACTNVEEEPSCSTFSKGRCKGSRSASIGSGPNGAHKMTQVYSVREYLERNRPDFVEQCSKRQHCLKSINENRAVRRSVSRELLSLQLQMQMDEPTALNNLRKSDLQEFAKLLGVDIKSKRLAPKFINERDMKKHSEKIYKSLPEVQRKKEEAKKERIKKTNLIMANLFKRNLQKKTLSGAVNISNYSNIVKI